MSEKSPRDPHGTPAGGIPRRHPEPHEATLLAQILEVVPGGIVLVGFDGAIRRANEQAKRFLGLSWDELRQRYISDFDQETFHEDGSACAVEDYPVARCLATGRPAGPTTIGVRQPRGEIRWAIFTALPFVSPGEPKVGAVVTFVDITERRRAELRTRAHGQLLDTVRMVHAQRDPSATVAVFHDPLAALLDLTSSSFGFVASVGEGDELRVHARIERGAERARTSQPPAPIDPWSEHVVRSGKRLVREGGVPLGGAFGRYVPQRIAIAPLCAPPGRVIGVVALADAPQGYPEAMLDELDPLLSACADLIAAFEERRRQRELEGQLAQAERLASVGTLAAGMAHEINNPLAYVLLNLDALGRAAEGFAGSVEQLESALAAKLGADEARALLHAYGLADVGAKLERAAQHASDAREGGARVQRIVRDLMTFSRVAEERKALVDVNAALEVALKMADHEIKYRARLVRDLGPLDPVLGNDGRLSQVFLNLLVNGARAIEEGRPDDNTISVRTRMEGDEVRIDVADTGVGVAPEHLDRLFEPFFSTRAPGAGAGLGLSICHNVVAEHGGRIEVASELGAGTRFTVRLPRATQVRTISSAPPDPGEGAPIRRPRILVVDDEPMVLRVLAQLLSRQYDVETAEGVEQSTRVLARGDTSYDVVLCDMMMLDGTGVDVHAWIREHQPALEPRVVFMTGGTFTPKARAFLANMTERHLPKPFSLRELDEIVRRVLLTA